MEAVSALFMVLNGLCDLPSPFTPLLLFTYQTRPDRVRFAVSFAVVAVAVPPVLLENV